MMEYRKKSRILLAVLIGLALQGSTSYATSVVGDTVTWGKTVTVSDAYEFDRPDIYSVVPQVGVQGVTVIQNGNFPSVFMLTKGSRVMVTTPVPLHIQTTKQAFTVKEGSQLTIDDKEAGATVDLTTTNSGQLLGLEGERAEVQIKVKKITFHNSAGDTESYNAINVQNGGRVQVGDRKYTESVRALGESWIIAHAGDVSVEAKDSIDVYSVNVGGKEPSVRGEIRLAADHISLGKEESSQNGVVVQNISHFQMGDETTKTNTVYGSMSIDGKEARMDMLASEKNTIMVRDRITVHGSGSTLRLDGKENIITKVHNDSTLFLLDEGKVYLGKSKADGGRTAINRIEAPTSQLFQTGSRNASNGAGEFHMRASELNYIHAANFSHTPLRVHGENRMSFDAKKNVFLGERYGFYLLDHVTLDIGVEGGITEENNISVYGNTEEVWTPRSGILLMRDSTVHMRAKKLNSIVGKDAAIVIRPSNVSHAPMTTYSTITLDAPSNSLRGDMHGIKVATSGAGASVILNGRTDIEAENAVFNMAFGKQVVDSITRIFYDEDAVAGKRESTVKGNIYAFGPQSEIQIAPKKDNTQGYVSMEGITSVGNQGRVLLRLTKDSSWRGPLSNFSYIGSQMTKGKIDIMLHPGATWYAGKIGDVDQRQDNLAVVNTVDTLHNDGRVILSDGDSVKGGQRLFAMEASGIGTYTMTLSKNTKYSDMLYIGNGGSSVVTNQLAITSSSAADLAASMQKGDRLRFAVMGNRQAMFPENSKVFVPSGTALTKPSFTIESHSISEDPYKHNGDIAVNPGNGWEEEKILFPSVSRKAGKQDDFTIGIDSTPVLAANLGEAIIRSGSDGEATPVNLYVVRGDDEEVAVVPALPSINAEQYAVTMGIMDTFDKRGGQMQFLTEKPTGIWTRFYNDKQHKANAYDNQHNYFELGYTWERTAEKGVQHYQSISGSWDHFTGRLQSLSGGLTGRQWNIHFYDTKICQGAYTDWHVRMGHIHNDMHLVASDGSQFGGVYGNFLGGISWERGVQRELKHGWSYTPQIQSMYTYAPRVSWTYLENGVTHDISPLHSLVTRLGITLHHTQKLKSGGVGRLGVGVHFYREWLGQQQVTLSDLSRSASQVGNLRGNWGSATMGYQFQNEQGALSVQVERGFGKESTTAWNYNFAGSLFF